MRCEGFIRQLLGWREFMRHIHEQTDGYRAPRAATSPTKPAPAPQEISPDTAPAPARAVPAHGSPTEALHRRHPLRPRTPHLPLPAAYWGSQIRPPLPRHRRRPGHRRRLVAPHHPPDGPLEPRHPLRLLPRELTDWFWFAYVDAYDWVVEPNVLGMATYADGGLTATKPYVSGAAYINRMSNFCGHCQYDPKKSTGPGSCPFTALYWTFLERNRPPSATTSACRCPTRTLARKPPAELAALRNRAEEAIAHLQSFPRPEY